MVRQPANGQWRQSSHRCWFTAWAISADDCLPCHLGSATVRCVTGNLLQIATKVLKFQMICFFSENGALPKLPLYRVALLSQQSKKDESQILLRWLLALAYQPSILAHILSVLDESRLRTTSIHGRYKVASNAFLERQENIWIPRRLEKILLLVLNVLYGLILGW